MKRIFALLFFAVVFMATVNAQRYSSTTCGLTPGPCVERMARQGYAPVDFMINNGYGYYPYGGGYYGSGRSAIIAGAAGLAVGLIVGRATAPHNGREYVQTSDEGSQPRQVIFAAPKPQKPLDCSKPPLKRGKNEAACAAFERRVCLANLATSKWFIRNASDTYPFTPTVNGESMVICGETVEVPPLATTRIFEPAASDSIGGRSAGAVKHGRKEEFNADVQPLNRPGFRGFVLWPPEPPKRGGN